MKILKITTTITVFENIISKQLITRVNTLAYNESYLARSLLCFSKILFQILWQPIFLKIINSTVLHYTVLLYDTITILELKLHMKLGKVEFSGVGSCLELGEHNKLSAHNLYSKKQVYILISKNQALQMLWLKHHVCKTS